MAFELYVVDTETVGLDPTIHSPIEISIYRLSNGEQKTWFIKPLDLENISVEALRKNGHKIDDLRGTTKYGREVYKDPAKTLIEIENWIAQDDLSSDDRILTGQNVGFDKAMLEKLWERSGSIGTYPLNQKYFIDTMCLEFAMDMAKNSIAKGYSLGLLCKKYGVKNERAHAASSDCLATVSVFRKQIETLKNALAK